MLLLERTRAEVALQSKTLITEVEKPHILMLKCQEKTNSNVTSTNDHVDHKVISIVDDCHQKERIFPLELCREKISTYVICFLAEMVLRVLVLDYIWSSIFKLFLTLQRGVSFMQWQAKRA